MRDSLRFVSGFSNRRDQDNPVGAVNAGENHLKY